MYVYASLSRKVCKHFFGNLEIVHLLRPVSSFYLLKCLQFLGKNAIFGNTAQKEKSGQLQCRSPVTLRSCSKGVSKVKVPVAPC